MHREVPPQKICRRKDSSLAFQMKMRRFARLLQAFTKDRHLPLEATERSRQ